MNNYERIYQVVGRIPCGKVTTYGHVARLAGLPGHARQVGYALNALPEDRELPWQRVVNAKGEISARSFTELENPQRELLEAEGVGFDERGRIDLAKHRWRA